MTKKKVTRVVEPLRNPYAVIAGGIHAQSTDEEIRRAYLAAARTAHPDKGGGQEAMAALNTAYRDVRTEEVRASLRQLVAFTRAPCAMCGGLGCAKRQRGFTAVVLTCCADCGGLGYV